MITCQVEQFSEARAEIEPILPLHFEEIALNKDKFPLRPRWEIYLDREQAGELLVMTVRNEGELVGYYIGFISPGLHYETCLTCLTDIFYILKHHRGKAGFLLFGAVEKELRRRGVNRWFVGSKAKADASAFFELLEFDKTETHYSKLLED